MLFKEYVRLWHESVQKYHDGQYDESINLLRCVPAPCSRLCYNIACGYAKLHRTDAALRVKHFKTYICDPLTIPVCYPGCKVEDLLKKPSVRDLIPNVEWFTRAVTRDNYLAVAYFQRATMYLHNGDLPEARRDLETARALMRGNSCINLRPLGLGASLHLPQIQYCLAVVDAAMGDIAPARRLLTDALHSCTDDFSQTHVIQQAIDAIDNGETTSIAPMTIPTDVIFTPSITWTRQLQKMPFLIKPKVVAATRTSDMILGCHRAKPAEELKKQSATAKDDRLIHRSANNSNAITVNRLNSKPVNDVTRNVANDTTQMKHKGVLEEMIAKFPMATMTNDRHNTSKPQPPSIATRTSRPPLPSYPPPPLPPHV